MPGSLCLSALNIANGYFAFVFFYYFVKINLFRYRVNRIRAHIIFFLNPHSLLF